MIKLVRTFILGLATAAFLTGAVSAQTTTNEGAFDALSTGNQKIVNAIHDAQIETSTLSTDDIAAKKLDGSYGGWGKIYQQMYADGLVEFKNLGQAVSSYHHANKPPPPPPPSPSTTVITTASGQKIIVGGSKPGHFGKSQSNSAKSNGGKKSFTPGKGASVTITTAGGGTHGGAVSGSAKHGGGSSVGITSAGGGGGHGYGKAKSGKGK